MFSLMYGLSQTWKQILQHNYSIWSAELPKLHCWFQNGCGITDFVTCFNMLFCLFPFSICCLTWIDRPHRLDTRAPWIDRSWPAHGGVRRQFRVQPKGLGGGQNGKCIAWPHDILSMINMSCTQQYSLHLPLMDLWMELLWLLQIRVIVQ